MSRTIKLPAMLAVAAIALLNSASPAPAAQQTVEIGTLEWPPYVGANLPQQGATTAVLKAAFAAAGYDVKLDFLPWSRAVSETADGTTPIRAFFPAYHCKQHPGLVASTTMGSGPLGVAERVAAPLDWKTLDDLKGHTIGTVIGYANTPDFDARVADGRLKTDPANSDVLNLRKLIAGRIDGAVIDRYVFEYLMKTDPSLKPDHDKVRLSSQNLDDKQLYLCARDDAEGRTLIQNFDKGLASIDVPSVIAAYFHGL